jgi:extracellular factor (EF) 3-hydroxypalmitic acid methyl ester biosynthesis protein
MLIVSAKLLDPWIGLSTLIREEANSELRSEIASFIAYWEKANRLRESFVLAVNRLRSFLGELSRWLGPLDVEYGQEYPAGHAEICRETVERLGKQLIPRMVALFQEFEYEASEVPVEQLEQHKAFAQRDLHPLVLSAPFVHRTFSKPLGYAGDFEMMNMIQGDSIQGPTIYASLVNTLFLAAPIPRSVRNRIEMLHSHLASESMRVWGAGGRFRALSVGCGSAIEVQKFLAEGAGESACDFTLLDFNEETLRYAQAQLNSIRSVRSGGVSIEFVRESVHNLLKIREKGAIADARYDFVYCSGLFDYLSDRVCARLLSLFYSWVRPGGLVLVTNMHSANPDKYIMDYLMEWYLNYRDEESMRALYPTLGKQRVFADETGINVSLEIRKGLAGDK